MDKRKISDHPIIRKTFGGFFYGSATLVMSLSLFGLSLALYAFLTGQISFFEKNPEFSQFMIHNFLIGFSILFLAYTIYPLQALRPSKGIFEKIAIKSDKAWNIKNKK